MQHKQNTAILVQARLTSKRLPNKVLLKIKNKTLLEIMYSRLKFSKKFSKIIFIIPNNKKNNKLFFYLRKKKIPVERGHHLDVMKRYYQIAKKNSIDHIMRLTADCPLIDYKICEKILNIYKKKKSDLVFTGKTFADGLDCEIFNYKSLSYAINNFKRSKIEKEHVTIFFKKRKKIFKILEVNQKPNHKSYRITIDYPSDFKLIKEIINKFSQILKNKYVSSFKIINYIKRNVIE